MAYFVRRPLGRWEIRESYRSENGPRARTLATFRVLSPEVMSRAEHVAHRPFDKDQLHRAATRNGVPIQPSAVDGLAMSLVRALARGEKIRPGLARLLVEQLGGSDSSVDRSLAPWVGSSLEERSTALIDLLGLADRLPAPRKEPLLFPGLSRPSPKP